jgi:tRNA nucleotidyltransferase/poly(A) polymerase
MNEVNTAKEVCRIIKDNGFLVFFAGGCVRDSIIGRDNNDIDIATNAKPDQIIKLFKHVIPTGIEHGTVTVIFGDYQYEITTFRSESDYSDGRHPDKVILHDDPKVDASRRDLTINSIFYDPIEDKHLDYFNGINDINNRIIRFVGNPMDRIHEDRLRALRAIRFSAQLNFDIDKDTIDAIKNISIASDPLKGVSIERIRDELVKILLSDKPSKGIYLLKEVGLLDIILPEIIPTYYTMQSPKWHREGTVFMHILLVIAGTPKDLISRVAALLHDIAKPVRMQIVETKDGWWKYSNKGHDLKGADMARDILTRFKFPNEDIDSICTTISQHMDAHDLPKMTKMCRVRRFVGQKNFDTIYNLAIADDFGAYNSCEHKFIETVSKYRDLYPIMLPSPIITGKDLISLGYKPGESFKRVLDLIYDKQLNGCEDKDELLKYIKGVWNNVNKDKL